MKSSGLVLKERAYTSPVAPPDTFEDESRFGNNGVHTAITWVREPSSGLWVRSFNGATSVVNLGNDASLMLTDAHSIEVWMRRNTASRIEAIWGSSTIAGYNLRMANEVGYFDTRYYDAGGVNSLALWDVPADTWLHIVVTFVASLANGWSIYRNGALGSQVNAPATLTTPGNILLGDMGFAGGTLNLDGYIALARIYNYALSPTAIGKHYQAERRFFGV